MFNLRDKGIIITGASQGLGAVCARALAREGARLALLARNKDKMESLRESLDRPERHVSIPVDITKREQLSAALMTAAEFLKEVDVILHAAGGGLGLRDHLLSSEEFDTLLALNLTAGAEINRQIIPRMKQRGRGNVVHICSIASQEATGSVGYNTTKAALAGYVRSLGRELAPFGVVVTGIMPGGFSAPENSWKRFEARDPEGVQRFIRERLPRGRLGEAEELIPLLLFLCSDKASMMGGCLVPIDAGEGKSYLI